MKPRGLRTVNQAHSPNSRSYPIRGASYLALGVLVIGIIAVTSGAGVVGVAADPPAGNPKEPTVGGIPLFANWPKDTQPEVALVLSGQSFGLLQPCGCSRPQFGGIERRTNFMKSLREKGWPVAGVDLGDIYPQKALEDQGLLRYRTMMNALREMGYIAVGLGKTDYGVSGGIDRLLGEYALQKEQPPFILVGNIRGLFQGQEQPRATRFPPPGVEFQRPMIGEAEIAMVGNVPVGVVGIAGQSVADAAKMLDPSITFADPAVTLKAATAALAADPKKPQLNVLLFQGTLDEAKAVAKAWPQFAIVLCQSDDPEPPQSPTLENDGRTMIIQVGHKGRYVGVVGAFKRAGGGLDLKYQLVSIGEELITVGTEEEARKANPALPRLEAYAEVVRDRKFLAKMPQLPHPAQIQEPKLNLSYVGSARCAGCHAAPFAKWNGTTHSHAMEALEKVAKRPSLRNFDPECVVCHTVGFGHKAGYEDDKKTPELRHVGCESCHGPGSGHAANPSAPNLLALQSPWRRQPGDKLPATATMKKLAEMNPLARREAEQQLPAGEQRAINAVSGMCMKCHDMDNDPHFELHKYWPKIAHPK